MDLESIAFISTYKSWHCVTSIEIALKKYCYLKFTCQKQRPAGDQTPQPARIFTYQALNNNPAVSPTPPGD